MGALTSERRFEVVADEAFPEPIIGTIGYAEEQYTVLVLGRSGRVYRVFAQGTPCVARFEQTELVIDPNADDLHCSADLSRVVTEDDEVSVYDVDSGELILRVDDMNGAAFLSPDGRQLYLVEEDVTLCFSVDDRDTPPKRITAFHRRKGTEFTYDTPSDACLARNRDGAYELVVGCWGYMMCRSTTKDVLPRVNDVKKAAAARWPSNPVFVGPSIPGGYVLANGIVVELPSLIMHELPLAQRANASLAVGAVSGMFCLAGDETTLIWDLEQDRREVLPRALSPVYVDRSTLIHITSDAPTRIVTESFAW